MCPWQPLAATYTRDYTWTPEDAKQISKIDVTEIDWRVLHFLQDLAEEICCQSEIKGIARSLLYDVSTLEANLSKYPEDDKFEWTVLLTFVEWYSHVTGTIQWKIDTIRRAFNSISLQTSFDHRLEDHLFRIPGYLPHHFNIP